MVSAKQPRRNFGLKPGQVIGPQHHTFKLVERLHDAASFQLWRAEDLKSHNVEVSLQLIDPQLARIPAFVEQFKRVINQGKLLEHPHIAESYGYFIHNRQILFSASAALEGRHLGQLFDADQISKLTLKQRRGLLSQLAQALDFAYQTLHRPHGALAPDQIYLNRQGGVQLCLYGSRDMHTRVLEQLKTPPQFIACQAPEAFHSDQLSRSADIYALATICYGVFTGQLPFTTEDDEASRVQRELVKPDEISESGWQILLSALDTDPAQRPKTASSLVKALLSEEDETPSSTPDSTPAEQTNPLEESSTKAVLKDETMAEETDDKENNESAVWLTPRHQRWLVRGAIATSLFGVGLATGFWLGLWASSPTIDSLNSHISRMQTLASEQETLLEAAETRHQLQQQQIRELEARLADATAELKAASAPAFELFRDPLQTGDQYGPTMVIVPAGTFLMGDNSKRADDNEKPAHEVSIPAPFALAQYEVTVAEYDLFAKATGRPFPGDNGWGRGNIPVTNVSWQDASAYADWLAEQTGLPYRLPTEAEWEYAARAGTTTDFWWGERADTGNTVCSECGSDYDGRQPAPAGELPLNPWGLSAMNGNVDEWVQDCYRPEYTGAPTDGSAWLSSICEHRVMRGGSWFDIARVSRASSRYRHPASSSRNNWGFRVALDLPAAQ